MTKLFLKLFFCRRNKIEQMERNEEREGEERKKRERREKEAVTSTGRKEK